MKISEILIILLLLIFLASFIYPVIKPFYLSFALEPYEKDVLALELIVKQSEYIEPDFTIENARLLTNNLIKTDNGLYEIIYNIENYKNGNVYSIKKTNFDVDIATFEIAQPIILNDDNAYDIESKRMPYASYFLRRGKYSRGDTSKLFVKKYKYKYFKDKDNIYYIDEDTYNMGGKAINPGEIINNNKRLKLQILENATSQDWQFLNERYTKTNEYVYIFDDMLYSFDDEYNKIYADPKTFQVTSQRTGRDKNGIWENGVLKE